MARYLVTGGCGFIGSHVADALVSAGHWVRVLDNLSTGKRANAPASAELVVGDICDFAVVKRCVERRIDDPRRGWHLPCGLEQMDGAAKIDRMAFEPFPQ